MPNSMFHDSANDSRLLGGISYVTQHKSSKMRSLNSEALSKPTCERQQKPEPAFSADSEERHIAMLIAIMLMVTVLPAMLTTIYLIFSPDSS